MCAGWLVPFVGLMVLGGVVVTPSFAQAPVAVDPSHYRVEFEDEHVRVLRVRLEPGREVMAHDHPDAVLVYFTADLHGRMPPAEAQWQPAGVHEPENAARTWFEAVLVELKQAAPQEAPPAAVAQEADPYWVGTRVTRLLDNAKVTVSKYRLAPMARGELRPYHLNEAVIVYLRGGYLVGSTADSARTAITTTGPRCVADRSRCSRRTHRSDWRAWGMTRSNSWRSSSSNDAGEPGMPTGAARRGSWWLALRVWH